MVTAPPNSLVRSRRPQLLAACEDYYFATWHSIFIICWRGKTTVQAAQAAHQECARFARSQPRGMGLLTLVGENAPPPGADARQVIAESLRTGSGVIRGSAVVVEGVGFASALVRAVATGISMLARQPFPHKVLSMQEAADFFDQQLRVKHRVPFDAQEFPLAVLALKEDVARRLEHTPSWRPSLRPAGTD